MANQKGTGKHPHKSAREPYPHTKDQPRGGQKNKSSTAKKQDAKSSQSPRKRAS